MIQVFLIVVTEQLVRVAGMPDGRVEAERPMGKSRGTGCSVRVEGVT